MSSDLTKYIESLPIHTFLLTSDLLVIGRIVESQVACVMINAICTIETFSDTTSMSQVIIPLMPINLEETTTIFRQHIVMQTPAGFALKKSYCDTLLKTKVQAALSNSQFDSSSSMSLETTDQNPNSISFNKRWNV